MSRDSPEQWLDAMGRGTAPELTLRRLVAEFPAQRIQAAMKGRVAAMWTRRPEETLRLLESFGDDGLCGELAAALSDGETPGAEWAWEALRFLADRDGLENWPALADWFDELNELLDAEVPASEELVEQIESDADGVWLSLQGLDAVELEVRPELVAGLATASAGPRVVEFLRLLAHAHHQPTREAALEALGRLPVERTAGAWARLAADHPDPEVAARASRLAAAHPLAALPVAQAVPRRCRVTAPDAQGSAFVLLSSDHDGEEVTACFGIDLMTGIREVVGHIGHQSGDALYDMIAQQPVRDVVDGDFATAIALIAGAMTLCDECTPVSLRYWLERTAGPNMMARPFLEVSGGQPLEDPARAAWLVLDACPWWVDDHDLVYELAEELSLRGRHLEIDAAADPGAVRFLFEGRLADRLELDRRCLLWMAAFWQARGQAELVRAALGLAEPLLDPQHAVPGNPFITELARRSLVRATEHLALGIDPREPEGRRPR